MAQMSEVVQTAMRLREQIKADEAAFETQLAPKKAMLAKLTAAVHEYLNEQGLQNLKVAGVGTAFKKKTTSCTVADWDVVWADITAREAWDMLNHAVNKTAVEAYVEEHGAPPPGVNYTAMEVVQFRKES
jgi:hypothetical protein